PGVHPEPGRAGSDQRAVVAERLPAGLQRPDGIQRIQDRVPGQRSDDPAPDPRPRRQAPGLPGRAPGAATAPPRAAPPPDGGAHAQGPPAAEPGPDPRAPGGVAPPPPPA